MLLLCGLRKIVPVYQHCCYNIETGGLYLSIVVRSTIVSAIKASLSNWQPYGQQEYINPG